MITVHVQITRNLNVNLKKKNFRHLLKAVVESNVLLYQKKDHSKRLYVSLRNNFQNFKHLFPRQTVVLKALKLICTVFSVKFQNQ